MVDQLNNRRFDYVDFFRGFGIIIMLMGHVGFGELFSHMIHSFHMPMFFFISGFLFKGNKSGIAEFGKKRALSLLLPYLSYGLLFYFIWILLIRDTSIIDPLMHLFFDNSTALPIADALWFLTALFIMNMICFIIEKVSVNYLKYTIIILFLLLGCFETRTLPFRLPFSMGAAFVGVGLFYIGAFLGRCTDRRIIHAIQNLKIWQTILLVIPTTLLVYINGKINMRSGIYNGIPLFWINAFLCIIIILNVSKCICQSKSLVITKISNQVKWIGKNSITFVCLNQLVIQALNFIEKSLIANKSALVIIVLQLLKLLITIATLWLATVLLQKSKYLKKAVGVK